MSIEYFQRRAILKRMVSQIIYNSNYQLEIRGSWMHSDFHLDPNLEFTNSDIDLISQSNVSNRNDLIIKDIENKLSNILKMKVSVHNEDHLTNIELPDSKIKNIYEYLIHFLKASVSNKPASDYFKAKIMMLLMKTVERNQRYAALRDEIASASMKNLYNIKIGIEKEIENELLEEMIISHGDATALSFYENCIKGLPDASYMESIHKKFMKCQSISNWLKSYILNKRSKLEE